MVALNGNILHQSRKYEYDDMKLWVQFRLEDRSGRGGICNKTGYLKIQSLGEWEGVCEVTSG